MFGIIADLLSSVLTILFPIFASYKAIRTRNPSELAPWLMYWVVMSIVLLVESWTYFIIGWFPFYSWIRLFALSYLVLPQTQGAKVLYLDYIEPFITQHEREIEDFISRTHESAKAAGLQYIYQAVDIVREKLGLPPAATAAPPPAPGAAGYAQSLLSRFTLPTAPAASSFAAPASDLYSLFSSTLASVGSSGKSRDSQAEELSRSGNLIPQDLASAPKSEQARYIASQRERLSVLLSAFDREHTNLQLSKEEADPLAYGTSYDMGGLRKNRSEVSFENIEHDDVEERDREHPPVDRRRGGGGGGGAGLGRLGAQFAEKSVDEIARATGSSFGR